MGATATAIAVRWDSRELQGIGIVGALLSPVLVDAGTSGVALAFMAIALVSATGVLVWKRWDWLAAAAFVTSSPQLVAWLADSYDDSLALALVVLSAFWVLYAVAALGYELRDRTESLRFSSASFLLADAILTSGAGWLMLDQSDHSDAATGWVIGSPSSTWRSALRRCEDASPRGLPAPARGRDRPLRDRRRARAGRACARRSLVGRGGPPRLARAPVGEGPRLHRGSRLPGGGVGAHTRLRRTSQDQLHGVSGVVGDRCARAGERRGRDRLQALPRLVGRVHGRARPAGARRARLPRADRVRGRARRRRVGGPGSCARVPHEARASQLGGIAPALFVGLAAAHTLLIEAPPPLALRDGVDDLGSAFLAVAAHDDRSVRRGACCHRTRFDKLLTLTGAVGAIYAPSVVIVDLTSGGEHAPGQTPQVLLSAFWSATGPAAVVYGLVRDDKRLRLGKLALLGLAAAKVIAYDLKELDEIYRVLSFVALGLLLLAGAVAYQAGCRKEGEGAIETVAVLAAASLGASVQQSDFQYTRVLPNPVAGGAAGFEADGLLLAHTRPGFADLRVVDADGAQVPWRFVPDNRLQVGVPAVVINSGRQGNAAVALVNIGPGRRVCRRVELAIAGGNFVGRVTRVRRGCAQRPFHETLDHDRVRTWPGDRRRRRTIVLPPTDQRFLQLRASGVARLTGATVLDGSERSNLVRRRHAVLGGAKERARTSVYTLNFAVPGTPVTRLELAAASGDLRQARPSRRLERSGHVRAARQRPDDTRAGVAGVRHRARVALPLPPRDDQSGDDPRPGVRQDPNVRSVVRGDGGGRPRRPRSVCSTART